MRGGRLRSVIRAVLQCTHAVSGCGRMPLHARGAQPCPVNARSQRVRAHALGCTHVVRSRQGPHRVCTRSWSANSVRWERSAAASATRKRSRAPRNSCSNVMPARPATCACSHHIPGISSSVTSMPVVACSSPQSSTAVTCLSLPDVCCRSAASNTLPKRGAAVRNPRESPDLQSDAALAPTWWQRSQAAARVLPAAQPGELAGRRGCCQCMRWKESPSC